MASLVHTGALIVTSCWCGIGLAIPQSLYDEASRRRGDFEVWCPLGHKFVYGGQSEEKRLKAHLERERDRLAATQAELDGARNSLRTTKGVVTKMRKRAIAGACQFCHRHFENVERHVANQHPEERA